MTVPARFRAPCHFCREPVDTRPGGGAYREERGWAPVRKAGGTSSLALRRESGRFAHKVCVDQERARVNATPWHQPGLFDDA